MCSPRTDWFTWEDNFPRETRNWGKWFFDSMENGVRLNQVVPWNLFLGKCNQMESWAFFMKKKFNQTHPRLPLRFLQNPT